MITLTEFKGIEFEVKQAIYHAFVKAQSNQDYYLILCGARYAEILGNTSMNKYIIDYRLDHYYEESRLRTLVDYLNAQYNFPKIENTSDSKFSLTLELMSYTHLWESKPFLKQLENITLLCEGQDYNWDVNVPDYPKHPFIISIKERLNAVGLDLGQIIGKSFHSSLRNAFAHSEYNFNSSNRKIELLNYRVSDVKWALKEVTYDEWTVRFCYSFLLNYFIIEKIEEEKDKLDGQIVKTRLKDKDGNYYPGEIKYDKKRNGFTGTLFNK